MNVTFKNTLFFFWCHSFDFIFVLVDLSHGGLNLCEQLAQDV
jgi:hypothetical protein